MLGERGGRRWWEGTQRWDCRGGQVSIASKVSRLAGSRGRGGWRGRAVADRQAVKNSHSIAEC